MLLNPAQKRLAKAICGDGERLVVVLKSRQVGATTFFLLLDIILCILNDNIKIALVVDRDKKARQLLKRALEMIQSLERNLGIQIIESFNSEVIRFLDGSELHSMSAGSGTGGRESSAGRSHTFHVLHITELPYWQSRDAFNALLAAAPGSPVFIESTGRAPDGDGPAALFYRLFSEQNDYYSFFSSVEEHSYYRDDPNKITDDEWSTAKELGFTIRECASWWLTELKNRGGDFVKHLHDYPVVPEHAFQEYEDRYIKVTPRQRAYSLLPDTNIKVFNYPEEQTKYIAGVDISTGVGKDASCVVVLNAHTKELVASWYDNRAIDDDIIEVMKCIHELYDVSYFAVEKNGIGGFIPRKAAMEGMPIRPVWTDKSSKFRGLLESKKAIEAGIIYGPFELVEECGSLSLKDNGKPVGKKDMLMALGFALCSLEDNPIPKPEVKDTNNYYYPELFEEYDSSRWF